MNRVINAKEFWDRVDTLLATKNARLKDMCEFTGIELNTVSIMRTQERVPSLDDTYLISCYLGCSFDYLIGKSKVGKFKEKEQRIINAYNKSDIISQVSVERILNIDNGEQYTKL